MKKSLFKPAPAFIPIIVISEFAILMLSLFAFVRINVKNRNIHAKAYYGNDENYQVYSGTIDECDYPDFLKFKSIIDEEDHEVSCARTLGSGTLKIHSNDNKALWDVINFRSGMNITFTAAFNKYLYYPPIVSITVDDNVVLSFEEGKTALLDYIISNSDRNL